MKKQLTKLTPGYKNLDDMTPFQGGPRFCEMKTVSKAHIRQADFYPYPGPLFTKR